MSRKLYILILAAIAVIIPAASLAQPMDVEEVVKLVKKNTSDTVIIAQIEATESYFNLSTDDLIDLKEAGASDSLVQYMILRKPGSTTTTTGGANTTGRTTNGNGETPPPQKFVDLTVNVEGKYTVSSQADLNVFYGAFLDGEKIYYYDQWTRIMSFTTPETGVRTTKRILEPGSFSVKIPTGEHTLSLVCWSGHSVPTDNVVKGSVIYSKKLSVKENAPVTLNLSGETDTTSDKFVIR
ncbi:MAG: hypothetical protein PVH29_02670 [Candidatus Zixiibacteriota bacterium]|jgi:hypothetical protein